jgi:carboxyl-terminal processing protease
MIKKVLQLNTLGLLFAGLMAGSLHAKMLDVSDFTPLTPEKDQMRANALIAYQLQRYHYNNLTVDTQVSEKVFDEYLKTLDGQKLYFLAADIEEFNQYRNRLDGALKTGQLDPAFRIYNRYQRRVIERLQFSLSLMDKGIDKFDFNKAESIEIERKDVQWSKTEAELNDLWRKRIKSAILSLKLAGKETEDIAKTLKKRYQSQLNRVLQAKSEDAFQLYMNAFTGVYDPHTNYFSPQTSENFNINMSLSLEGIGAVLQTENEHTKILRLVPAGPADKQGELHPADKIVGVGQDKEGEIEDVIGWRLDEVVNLIRGPKGTSVRLEVMPADSQDASQTKIITIVRDTVKLEEQAAQSKILEIERAGKTYKLGVIDIPTFYADFQAIQNGDPDARRTTTDVQNLLDELVKEGIDGLIVDLRNNGGGSLGEANALTGLFIDEGPTVQIRYARGGVEVMKDPNKGIAYDGPMAVLVNRLSASASEIFAGAIQDYGRGIIVGEQTFGKGTVQQIRPLQHGQLKLTQAKFYRVSGASTQHKGVEPDISLPSLIDKKEIGEDSLPAALPWDQIVAANYAKNPGIEPSLPSLQSAHDERMKASPDYQLLLEEIQFINKQRQQTELSLQEEARKAEKLERDKQQLDLVNRKRTLEGEKPLAKLVEESEDKPEPEAKTDKKLDFVVKETGEVILDYIEFNKQVVANQ